MATKENPRTGEKRRQVGGKQIWELIGENWKVKTTSSIQLTLIKFVMIKFAHKLKHIKACSHSLNLDLRLYSANLLMGNVSGTKKAQSAKGDQLVFYTKINTSQI